LKKKIYCTLDTETVGGASKPKGIYHLGGIIHDREGNVMGCFNYLIAEWLPSICSDKYAKKSLPLYLTMRQEGTATLITTEKEAISAVKNLLDHYNVKTLLCFNTGFDLCKTSCKDLLEGRNFIDLWHIACEVIGQKKSYADFCRKHELLSATKKTVSTSAETFYAYLTDNPSYAEEHTALEDSKIELAIFVACMKTKRKFTPNIHHYDFEAWRKLHQKV
jgi:hypothetical protein